jgi:hypothetical protein
MKGYRFLLLIFTLKIKLTPLLENIVTTNHQIELIADQA